MIFEKYVDGLTIERYGFYLYENVLFLDSYSLLQKESKKHKMYQTIKHYERINGRSRNTISEKDVPFDEKVKDWALSSYFSQIRCKLWSEK